MLSATAMAILDCGVAATAISDRNESASAAIRSDMATDSCLVHVLVGEPVSTPPEHALATVLP
jgi:hypothetical protein